MSCCGGTENRDLNSGNYPTKTQNNILSLKNEGAQFNKKVLFDVNPGILSVENFPALTLNPEQLSLLYNSEETNFSLDVPGRNGITYTLLVSEVFLYSPEYYVTNGEGNVLDIPRGRHYFGIVEGEGNSSVVLNVFQDQFSGSIQINRESIEILRETVEVSSSYLIKTKEAPTTPFSCLTDTSVSFTNIDNLVRVKVVSNNCARIYFDVSDTITNLFAGSVPNTNAYMTSVFATIAQVYLNDPDVEVTLFLAGMTVYTTTPPFVIDLPGYGAYRTANPIVGSQMYNFCQITGAFSGVAWLGTFCQTGPFNPPFAGPFSFNNLDAGDIGPTGTINPPYPAYSWTAKVLSHEMGHVFGSPHTFDCNWIGPSGPNSSLGGCYVSGINPGCVDCASSNPDGPCFQPGPSGFLYVSANGATGLSGQTIMSYCDPVPLVFGPQPGAIVRAAVDGCTGCIVCVHPNTCILLPDGSEKKIRDLKRGDWVAGNLERTVKYHISKINIASYPTERLMDIVVFEKDSLGKNMPSERLITTDGHPIFYKGHRRSAYLFQKFKGVTFHKQTTGKEFFEISKQGMLDLYDLQFDDDGTYIANGVQCQSRCPWSCVTPLPKNLYFDLKLYRDERSDDSINHTIPRDWSIVTPEIF